MTIKFEVEFETDNAAFENNKEAEIEKVLDQAKESASLLIREAPMIKNAAGLSYSLFDSNGNRIGQVTIL